MEGLEQFEGSFHDENWVKLYGLDEEKVLAYFSCSQFYDRSCNNERCVMQKKDLSFLKRMKGYEYVVIRNPHEPRLFIIAKQRRLNEAQATKVAIYYVLDRVIYQAPNMASLILSRLQKCAEKLNSSFLSLQNATEYVPTTGYTWNFPQSDDAEKWGKSPEVASYELKRRRIGTDNEAKHRAAMDTILATLAQEYQQDQAAKQEPTAETSGQTATNTSNT